MSDVTLATESELGDPLSERELCPDELLAGQEAAFARDIARLHARREEHVRVPCPACGSDAPEAAFSKYGFAFQRCPDCGTLYMSPRPSEALMADYYTNSENYAYWAEHIFPASEAARREKIHKPWLARVLNYCETFGIRRDLLLEVGPGFGTFSALATASGAFARVVGVEPTPEMAAACRARGVEVVEKRIEDLGSEVGQADVVCAFEVIEHLFAPRRFLAGIAPRVAAGGLLVLSCPNGEGFDIEMLGARSQAVDAEHVNLFNPRSLSALVEEAGFEVLRVHTPGRLDAEIVRDAALAGEVALPPFLKRVLLEEWDRLGWPFQQFLAEQGLSSHMWLAARKVA
ncbi:class I SAM-dependent methyltransferase [Algihabitans albus]|uniref:class I SAM-dependent methyltransferase n=1 Tax=Algihabitans albus TaxID=2164067 RepID=UPI0035D09F1D